MVQDVVIEHMRSGHMPLHGRIIFTTSLIIPLVRNRQARAKLMVNGKASLARGNSNVNREEFDCSIIQAKQRHILLDYGPRLVVDYRCIGQFMDVEHHP